MTAPHVLRGQDGEDVAATLLAGKGYRLLARNYRGHGCEIDLVCLDGDTVVFVEVKTRAVGGRARPDQAVTPAKRGRLVRAASCFLSERDLWESPCRFDVVAVEVRGERHTATHTQDAFCVDAASGVGGLYQPG